MPTIINNGIELYYEHRGPGIPVIYVHGGFASLATVLQEPSDEWSWENDFAAQFHFIWHDRRGCYRSSCPQDGYDLNSQARDLKVVIDSLQLDKVHVIGSSAGGPISIVFAAQHPDRIRSLILTGTGLTLFPDADAASSIIREQLSILDQHGSDYAFDHRPSEIEVSFGVLWEPAEMQARRTLTEYTAKQHVLITKAQTLPKAERVRRYVAELNNIRAYIGVDIHQYAHAVTAPTLILHGSEDREVPVPWGQELAQSMRTSQFHLLQGGSHSLMIRDALARQLAIDFLRRHE